MSHNQQQSNQHQSSTQPNLNGQLKASAPEAEVVMTSANRRRFSQSYKRKILAEAEQCRADGEMGSLLRREGLYASHITRWRQARERGRLEPGATPKRGRKADPQAQEMASLKRDNERLKQELDQAHLVIDIQKKVSQLLGLPQTTRDEQS
jgi:transposase-like protein